MYKTINKNVSAEITEKKSKFIANIYKISNREEAENKIKEMKKHYFDARHNCSCYRVMEGNQIIEKSSDDGEPSGTAGAPMLNILQRNNLCNIVVIVTRYFGGILLGTGGLVRAYSEATSKAIEEAEILECIEGEKFEVNIQYSEFEILKHYCLKNSINILNEKYQKDVICELEVYDINQFLKDIENRKINLIIIKKLGKIVIEKK